VVTFREIARAVRDPRYLWWTLAPWLRILPFRLGVSTPWPGTHLSYVPDRYRDNYRRYRDAGGAMNSEERRAFLAGNQANNAGDLARFYFLTLVCDQIAKERLAGDVAELGVYKGNTAVVLARLARQLDRTAYLFDTFAGFSKEDLVGVDWRSRADQFSDTSLARVRAKVGEEHVRYVVGHFPATASGMPDNVRFCLGSRLITNSRL
jgi:Macrocin-O-methyltransferase (TylF)